MKDIVERIRSLRYVHVPVASQLFEEAAQEIESLRLTQDEREAIQVAMESEHSRGDLQLATTLQNLLRRTA